MTTACIDDDESARAREVIRAMALSLMEQRELSDALHLLRVLVWMAPGDSDAWQELAECHIRLGDKETALSLRALGHHMAELVADGRTS